MAGYYSSVDITTDPIEVFKNANIRVEDFSLRDAALGENKYVFTSDEYFFGDANVRCYHNDPPSLGSALYNYPCSMTAAIYDENGNIQEIIFNLSGSGIVNSDKLFIPVKTGWSIQIISASYDRSRGDTSFGAYISATAIYVSY